MDTVYWIWALLPLTLLFITLRAIAKRVLKRPGIEYPGDYIKQVIYTTVFLFVAIGIDRFLLDDFLSTIPLGDADPRIIRWLLYPAVLGIAAYVQHIFDVKAEKLEREERDRRQKDYMQRHF